MAALYTDPDLIQQATELERRGRNRDEIAEAMSLSVKTVRKMLDPAFAESERRRLAEVDKARAPLRRQDPDYRAYQAEVGKSDAHRARVRIRKAEREGRIAGPGRKGGDPEAMQNVAAAVEAVVARRKVKAVRVTAEETRRAATATVRAHTTLSVEASAAANRLMQERACSWDDLIVQLLLEAAPTRGA